MKDTFTWNDQLFELTSQMQAKHLYLTAETVLSHQGREMMRDNGFSMVSHQNNVFEDENGQKHNLKFSVKYFFLPSYSVEIDGNLIAKGSIRPRHAGRAIGVWLLIAMLLSAVFVISFLSVYDPKILNSIKSQLRDELPIEVNYRDAVFGEGLVAAFTNSTSQHLRISVIVENTTLGTRRTFDYVIAPNSVKEIGHLEGWSFASGDRISLYNDKFAAKELVVP